MRYPCCLLAALLLSSVFSLTASAQYNFDPKLYDPLTSYDAAQTVPVGTRITLQNWQQYKQFMPIGLQAAFGAGYTFHVTSDPMYAMVVGPTTHVTAPRQWLKDGEKYGSQVKLVPASTWFHN